MSSLETHGGRGCRFICWAHGPDTLMGYVEAIWYRAVRVGRQLLDRRRRRRRLALNDPYDCPCEQAPSQYRCGSRECGREYIRRSGPSLTPPSGP